MPHPTAVQHEPGGKRAKSDIGGRQIGWTARSKSIFLVSRIRAMSKFFFYEFQNSKILIFPNLIISNLTKAKPN